VCRSQWPRGLRRGSAAYHLLGLRVRIPQRAWMSVCCVVEVSAMGLSLLKGSPTECGVPSRNLKNEAALARVGQLSHKERKSILFKLIIS
jgi:sugar phosphate permease